MAENETAAESASKVKGTLSSLAGQLFHPRNYVRNFAISASLVAATWVFAPGAMMAATAGAPTIAAGAGAGTNAANLAMASANQVLQAGAITLEGTGSMIVNSDPTKIGAGFDLIMDGLG